MTPDAIIILSGGAVVHEKEGRIEWRTTTYCESDGFGTLGGRDRVEAGAMLAQKYPDAYLVTTSHRPTNEPPTLAQIYADELVDLGVSRERILEEERSTTTETAVRWTVELAREKGWQHLIFVSSGYHLSRVAAFYELTGASATADFVSSESVLTDTDPAFATRFAEVQKTTAYQTRLAYEARGLSALQAGTYLNAPPEDKLER